MPDGRVLFALLRMETNENPEPWRYPFCAYKSVLPNEGMHVDTQVV